MRINKYKLGSNLIMSGIALMFLGFLIYMNSKAGIPLWQTLSIFFGSVAITMIVVKLIKYAAHLSFVGECEDRRRKEEEEKPTLMDTLMEALETAHKDGMSAVEIGLTPDGIKYRTLSAEEAKEQKRKMDKDLGKTGKRVAKPRTRRGRPSKK